VCGAYGMRVTLMIDELSLCVKSVCTTIYTGFMCVNYEFVMNSSVISDELY
jgi:hypothetical protein